MAPNSAKNSNGDDEPTIEEILDSIRQIISEDDDDVAAEPSARENSTEAEVDEPEAIDEGDDVFELTERVEEEDFATALKKAEEEEAVEAPVPQPSIPTEEVMEIDLKDIEVDDIVQPEQESLESAPIEESPPEPIEPVDVPDTEPPHEESVLHKAIETEDDAGDDDILTNKAADAVLDGFTDLVKKTAIDNKGSVTLEDIVRAELNPLLRTWLDKHLPKIIERLVREELEKLSKRAAE